MGPEQRFQSKSSVWDWYQPGHNLFSVTTLQQKHKTDIRNIVLNTHEPQNKTSQMRPNQSRAILIFLITPTTTWLFAGYPYTTETQKAAEIHFSTAHTHTLPVSPQGINERPLIPLIYSQNSCDHISTNGKAPLHSHINHNNPQFLYSLWRRAIANARNVSFVNLSRW